MTAVVPSKEDLKLTDLLARDRTTLANERTLLAYARTALMMAISGVTVVKLIPEWGAMTFVLGGVLCLLAIFTFAWGVLSYTRVKAELDRLG